MAELNKDDIAGFIEKVNKFTIGFAKEYCDGSGAILWNKLVKFNSGKMGK